MAEHGLMDNFLFLSYSSLHGNMRYLCKLTITSKDFIISEDSEIKKLDRTFSAYDGAWTLSFPALVGYTACTFLSIRTAEVFLEKDYLMPDPCQ